MKYACNEETTLSVTVLQRHLHATKKTFHIYKLTDARARCQFLCNPEYLHGGGLQEFFFFFFFYAGVGRGWVGRSYKIGGFLELI